jgi:hypothetical protein
MQLRSGLLSRIDQFRRLGPQAIGRQSVNLQATAYYNVVAPPGSGNWTLELLVQFLYPQ